MDVTSDDDDQYVWNDSSGRFINYTKETDDKIINEIKIGYYLMSKNICRRKLVCYGCYNIPYRKPHLAKQLRFTQEFRDAFERVCSAFYEVE